MIPDLTPRDILKYKKDALRSGINGFEGIKALQLDQLEDAVTKELHTYQDRFDALMRSDPDYKYPKKYADNHFGYWEDHSYNYQECVKILTLIREYRQGNIDSVPPVRPDPAQEEKGKYTAKYYVLTYILDTIVAGRQPPHANEKTKIEGIGTKYFNDRDINLSGNTFRKKFNEIINQDLNSERALLDIAGEEWREKVLSLSQSPDELDKYLKNKQL